MKRLDQLSTELQGQTKLSPERLFEAAEQAADQLSQGKGSGHSVVLQDAVEGTQRYAIHRGNRWVTTLEVWIELNAAGKLPSGPLITFHADWSDEILEREAEPIGGTVIQFISLLFGMKGYETYRRYLDTLAQTVRAADSDARVDIKVGE